MIGITLNTQAEHAEGHFQTPDAPSSVPFVSMTTYPDFDEAFDDIFKPTNGWVEDFGRMTFQEFNDFFDYVFEKRLGDIMNDREVITKDRLQLRLPMMFALCVKVLEAGHFCDGMDQGWRDSAEGLADTWFAFLMSLYGDTKQGEGMTAAWKSQKEHCDRFGYKSGVAFEILAPHHVFSSS